MTSRLNCRWSLVLAALLVALCGSACGVSNTPRVPGSKERAEVTRGVVRGDYIHGTLRLRDQLRGLFFPNDDACKRLLLVPGARVEFQRLGRHGRLVDGGDRCEALGTSGLAQWRDGRPRARGPQGRTADRDRRTARYKQFYEDADVLMVRGLLPLVGYLGYAADDAVAVVPANDACRAIVAREEALMEYRANGEVVLALLGGEDHCPIVGVAVPNRKRR